MKRYLAGWAALTRLMSQGTSWSGRERHNAFLNLRNGSFADVSSITGLDFIDDGRGVAVTDWDGDGDLDLWLRNRTGPQLRLMRNDAATGHWITIELTGTRSNRDAIGARVTIEAGGRRMVRTVTAGDGYLCQSSKRLHFGLGDAKTIDALTITWPSGATAAMRPPPVDRHYRVREDSDQVLAVQRGPAPPSAGTPLTRPPLGTTTIALRTPLPLPPSIRRAIAGVQGRGEAAVINLWSLTCPPCFSEIADWAANADQLRQAGIRVLALNVDPQEDAVAANARFAELAGTAFPSRPAGPLMDTLTTLVRHIRQLGDVEVTMPTSLLIDPEGNVDAVYLGATTASELIAHRKLFRRLRPHQRSLRGGRWFFSVPRDWKSLADLLPEGEDRDFYGSLK